ncbi:MAG TPA: hypothetical protein VGX23_00280 [Actinocrinis sp.]|nr:hypothetical protein [Actinocrinis sp.]
MTGLRRDRMRVGLEVGLREGSNGERLHGAISALDCGRVQVWVPDLRYAVAPPRALRGYQTALTYPAAEAGAMWPEPVVADHPGPGPTGHDLLAHWAWAHRAGTSDQPHAPRYHAAARQVLEVQPGGAGIDLSALDVADALRRFTAAHTGTRSANTLAALSSHFRRAMEIYLNQHATATPCSTKTLITLGDGRTLTVLAPHQPTNTCWPLATHHTSRSAWSGGGG